ncbi:MAG: cation:dicarboxylate symporter family transporter [Mycoplasmatales bacterium]
MSSLSKKKFNYLKLIVPIFLGLALGYTCGHYSWELPVRTVITLSDNILVIIKLLTPIILFTISATALSQMEGENNIKFYFLLKLFGIIIATLIVLGTIVFFLSLIVVPFLTFGFTNQSSNFLDPLFKISLPHIFSSPYVSLVSIALGLIIGFLVPKNSSFMKETKRLEDIIFLFFQKVITPIMPFWILGSFASTSYSNVGLNFILTDFLLSIFILILQFSWLFIMYLVVSKFFKINFKKLVTSGLDVFLRIVSISGMGTQVIIPYIIEKQRQLDYNVNKSTIITATSFNMPGSLISNIVFIIGVINLFNFNISFVQLFLFIFVLILSTIIAPSFPGGTAAITSTLTASMLGFSEDMVSIFYAMYYKQGISNSATNNAADLYISAFFKNKD